MKISQKLNKSVAENMDTIIEENFYENADKTSKYIEDVTEASGIRLRENFFTYTYNLAYKDLIAMKDNPLIQSDRRS